MTVGLGRVAADRGGSRVEDCGGLAVVSLCAEFVWRWTGVFGYELMFECAKKADCLPYVEVSRLVGEGVLGLGSARLQVVI